jgi:hypothetical protein
MNQLAINALPQSTGHFFICPGPRTYTGIQLQDMAPLIVKTMTVLNQMIDDLSRINKTANDNPPEILESIWAKDMVWYKPEGIVATYACYFKF